MPSLGNGSTCCDGLSVLAGGKIPPYGTHTFCMSDFLLEFLFLALLSKYLAFHSAAKRDGICGAGSVPGFTSSSRQALGGPQDPRTGSSTRGAAGSWEQDCPLLPLGLETSVFPFRRQGRYGLRQSGEAERTLGRLESTAGNTPDLRGRETAARKAFVCSGTSPVPSQF